MPEPLLTTAKAAELLGLDWRMRGRGPTFIRISRTAVRDGAADLEAIGGDWRAAIDKVTADLEPPEQPRKGSRVGRSSREKLERRQGAGTKTSESAASPSERWLLMRQVEGPLPPPAVLEYYEHVLPGTAERIVVMAEREQSHRHEVEGHSLRGYFDHQRRAQWMGFLVCLGALSSGVYLLAHGHGLEGLALLIGAIAVPVATIITGRGGRATARQEGSEMERQKS